MIKHIVLFKLKNELTQEEKNKVFATFRADILALPATIDCIRSIDVCRNVNEKETWDIALLSEFDTLDDVNTYATHPDHVAAAVKLRPNVAERSCVDAEV